METRNMTKAYIMSQIDTLVDDENYDMLDDYKEEELAEMAAHILYMLIRFGCTNVDYNLKDGSQVRLHNDKGDDAWSFASFSHDAYETGVSEYGYAFYREGYQEDLDIYDLAKDIMSAINQAYYVCINEQ